MEKFYKINGDFAEIRLSKNIYPLLSVKKAVSNFFEETYIKIMEENDNIITIMIKLKNLFIIFQPLFH